MEGFGSSFVDAYFKARQMRQEQQNLQLQISQHQSTMALEAQRVAQEKSRDENENNWRMLQEANQKKNDQRLEDQTIFTQNLQLAGAQARGEIVPVAPQAPQLSANPAQAAQPAAPGLPQTPPGIPSQSAIGQPGQPTTLPSQQAGAQVPLGAGLPPQLQQAAQQAASTVQGNPLAPPGQPPPSFGPATPQVASNGQRFVGPAPNLAQTPQGQPVSNPSGAQPALPTQQPPVVASPVAPPAMASTPQTVTIGGRTFAIPSQMDRFKQQAAQNDWLAAHDRTVKLSNAAAAVQDSISRYPDSAFAKDKDMQNEFYNNQAYGTPIKDAHSYETLGAQEIMKGLDTIDDPKATAQQKAAAMVRMKHFTGMVNQAQQAKVTAAEAPKAQAVVTQNTDLSDILTEAGSNPKIKDGSATDPERNDVLLKAVTKINALPERKGKPLSTEAIKAAQATLMRGEATPKSSADNTADAINKLLTAPPTAPPK